MLQTWRLNSKDQGETHQRQAFDPETARPIVQQACNSCRVKKLRCSGQKTGCFRCQTLSQECIYAQNATRGSARARKSKESASKGNSRRPSATPSLVSSASTPKNEVKTASPRQEPLTSTSSAQSSELHWAPPRPGSGQGNTNSLGVDMMPFESQDYLQMQGMSTTQTSGIEPYQSSDAWFFSWPDPAKESHFATAKTPWEETVLPLSIQTFGGWEPGVHGYDEMPITPTTRNPISESTMPDLQTSPLSMPLQMVAVQHGQDERDWLHSQTREPCQCLQRVVFLLEELDSESLGTNIKELGPWLSRHKEALRCSEALLTCSLCQAKPEHMTILTFLTDRLIAMCDNVVSAYLQTMEGDANNTGMAYRDAAWLVLVGNFEIDSPQEWSALVRTMLIMQLRGLDSFMVRFKDLLQAIGGEVVRRKADSTQNRISTLLEKLDPVWVHSSTM
ncbi:hypothetical protein F5B22DRAFT_659817 [Xylaria bambusicola]|uniref:uncharacterized protein n=1 Tax=Xylaria bambusicola TaxID=326684 RepID=UPI002008B31E|nr:uncharacterized protein F5B22DRAFT_659817 [Xylaria bambusicola]KAI0506899.1 hypothetical protein F5B22DRAFT_659817 [Xylaria bambusicola]